MVIDYGLCDIQCKNNKIQQATKTIFSCAKHILKVLSDVTDMKQQLHISIITIDTNVVEMPIKWV